MKKLSVLSLAMLALGACGDNPAGAPSVPDEVVVTPGVAAPAPRLAPAGPALSTLENAQPSLGGSTTTRLALNGASCSTHPARAVTVTYAVSGNQDSPASFKVNTRWEWNGAQFVGSVPTTVDVAAKQGGGNATYMVDVSVENPAGTGSGNAQFVVAPFALATNAADPPGKQLAFGAGSSATVFVAFNDCTPSNTAPSLTLPSDVTAEATSSAGAAVSFVATASDAEDGDLTAAVVCTPPGGATFPLGTTTVSCSVTDAGGMSANGTFDVDVLDRTAPVFTSFPGNATLIAQNVNGGAIDLSSFGIAAEDEGPNGEAGDVSGPVSVSCKVGADAADGFQVAIGQTVTVSCTATDASSHPSPNTSGASTFDVFVTLDLSGLTGFHTPLRMAGPYSAHRAGSTIPHKFGAPRYADGSLATDLASGLRLVLLNMGNVSEEFDSETTADLAAGSTAWRWDADAQQYVFNVKTGKTWALNEWRTTASYAGIPLAQTYFKLNK